jgi:WD40 repeat protein
MENWKIEFLDESIITCGDLGRINFFDLASKEKTKKIEVGEIFLTSLARSNSCDFVATGNNNGDLYIINIGGAKDKVASLKPHYKLIRELTFLDDDSKLLTASDDGSIKIIDISSEKVVSILEGHKQSVSSISPHQNDPKIVFSSSFDKTIKSWDLRLKNCVGTAVTGSPLWDIKSVGKHLLAGG